MNNPRSPTPDPRSPIPARDLLVHIFSSDPEMRVVGAVSNGEEAVEAVGRCRPNLVMMDVHMPKMDGFEATRKIMTTRPVPIIIVSETLVDQVAATFRAIEAGALAFVRHPPGIGHPVHSAAAAELLLLAKLMAEIKVVRRWGRPAREMPARQARDTAPGIEPADIKLIAIGASTGGPIVLQGVLSALAPDLRVPVLVVQHIAPGFTQGLAEWLGQTCGLPVHVATHGELALPGHVYLAPDGLQMGISRLGRIMITSAPAEHGLCPSVSYLFRSVAGEFGPNAVGVLLTGMGRDGADELKLMRDMGVVTIAQDESSSVVHGMPGEAIRLDAAKYVLPPEGIAALLIRLLGKQGHDS
jgi:two-component system chemotaxis response regulator CheB